MSWNWNWMEFCWWAGVIIASAGFLVGFQACLIRYKTGLWPWNR